MSFDVEFEKLLKKYENKSKTPDSVLKNLTNQFKKHYTSYEINLKNKNFEKANKYLKMCSKIQNTLYHNTDLPAKILASLNEKEKELYMFYTKTKEGKYLMGKVQVKNNPMYEESIKMTSKVLDQALGVALIPKNKKGLRHTLKLSEKWFNRMKANSYLYSNGFLKEVGPKIERLRQKLDSYKKVELF